MKKHLLCRLGLHGHVPAIEVTGLALLNEILAERGMEPHKCGPVILSGSTAHGGHFVNERLTYALKVCLCCGHVRDEIAMERARIISDLDAADRVQSNKKSREERAREIAGIRLVEGDCPEESRELDYKIAELLGWQDHGDIGWYDPEGRPCGEERVPRYTGEDACQLADALAKQGWRWRRDHRGKLALWRQGVLPDISTARGQEAAAVAVALLRGA